MKLKLIALMSFIMVALAGCGGTTPTNTANSNTAASPAAATSSPAAVAQNSPGMVPANAQATEVSGGTSEGCKCSAVGMACNTKEGGKGCCGGKDGTCSAKRDGIAKCCTPGKDGGSCCSTSKTTVSADHKDMKDMKGM